MTKNYKTIWERWATAKTTIVKEHERLQPLIETIKSEIQALSGQALPSTLLDVENLPIKFYPFWKGFAYTYSHGWDERPNPNSNWSWSLKETEEVAKWMSSLEEEEVKILFRNWSESQTSRTY